MVWTTTSLVIQAIAGVVGAHTAANALRNHAFGFWGHTIVGLVAGTAGGCFLQTYAATVVTGNGSAIRFGLVNFFLQALTGAVLGGLAMLAAGMLLACGILIKTEFKHGKERRHKGPICARTQNKAWSILPAGEKGAGRHRRWGSGRSPLSSPEYALKSPCHSLRCRACHSRAAGSLYCVSGMFFNLPPTCGLSSAGLLPRPS